MLSDNHEMKIIQYITIKTHIYALHERMCTMQGKNKANGKELCDAWGGGTYIIVPNHQNIKTIKDYER